MDRSIATTKKSKFMSIAMNLTKREDDDDDVSELDKISTLPQVLLQHIQYYLSPKQAAQTITLSKLWRNSWSNNNGPDIDLNQATYQGTDDEFHRLVNDTLQGYHDLKLRVNEFKLELLEMDHERHRVLLLDKNIPMVRNMGVKVFHLMVQTSSTSRYYRLPSAVFEAESIMDLFLMGCRLDHYYYDNKVADRVMFKHLKVLHLFDVIVEEKALQRIISSCPLIEDMELSNCEGVKTIKLNSLQKLKKISIMCYDWWHVDSPDEERVPSIGWGVTNLESITILGCVKFFSNLDAFLVFDSLKDLSLTNVGLSGVTFTQYDFWCSFSSLENLKLENCFGLEEDEQLQILSHSIKHISLTDEENWCFTRVARINAPNILSFEYKCNYIPPNPSFGKTCSKWTSNISLTLKDQPNSSWLLKLNEMLTGGLSQSQISLTLNELPYHHDHHHLLQNHQQYNSFVRNLEPVQVEELMIPFEQRYLLSSAANVIDDLFSVVRPINVDVRWYATENCEYERESNEFTKDVCKILMERNQKSSSTSGQHWQKHLKEVSSSTYDFVLDEVMCPLHGMTSLRKCECPVDDRREHRIRFQLMWRNESS